MELFILIINMLKLNPTNNPNQDRKGKLDLYLTTKILTKLLFAFSGLLINLFKSSNELRRDLSGAPSV